jgi:hypothetical protein
MELGIQYPQTVMPAGAVILRPIPPAAGLDHGVRRVLTKVMAGTYSRGGVLRRFVAGYLCQCYSETRDCYFRHKDAPLARIIFQFSNRMDQLIWTAGY